MVRNHERCGWWKRGASQGMYDAYVLPLPFWCALLVTAITKFDTCYLFHDLDLLVTKISPKLMPGSDSKRLFRILIYDGVVRL